MQERRAVVPALTVRRTVWSRRLLIPTIAALVVAADQFTKTWALHHLEVPRHVIGPTNLLLTFNGGAAFSIGRGVTPFIEAVVVAMVIWLVLVSSRASRSANLGVAIGLGLLLGGRSATWPIGSSATTTGRSSTSSSWSAGGRYSTWRTPPSWWE